jgi:hypothetical protein
MAVLVVVVMLRTDHGVGALELLARVTTAAPVSTQPPVVAEALVRPETPMAKVMAEMERHRQLPDHP